MVGVNAPSWSAQGCASVHVTSFSSRPTGESARLNLLRLSGLFGKVTHTILVEALGNSCCLSFARRERRDQTLEECYGAFTEFGRVASNFLIVHRRREPR